MVLHPNVFAVASDGLKLRFGAAGARVNLWQPLRSTAELHAMSGFVATTRAEAHRLRSVRAGLLTGSLNRSIAI